MPKSEFIDLLQDLLKDQVTSAQHSGQPCELCRQGVSASNEVTYQLAHFSHHFVNTLKTDAQVAMPLFGRPITDYK